MAKVRGWFGAIDASVLGSLETAGRTNRLSRWVFGQISFPRTPGFRLAFTGLFLLGLVSITAAMSALAGFHVYYPSYRKVLNVSVWVAVGTLATFVALAFRYGSRFGRPARRAD